METQLRLTQEPPHRRGYPSSKRLSADARRTGREGVAMARRELDRVRNATIATSASATPDSDAPDSATSGSSTSDRATSGRATVGVRSNRPSGVRDAATRSAA